MASIQLAIAPLIMILSLISIQMADAQAPAEESCISNLVPCVNYLNATTKPPSSCCDPLRVAVTKQLDCLCNIYKNPDLTKTFNVNVTQALALPGLCGIPGNVAECNKASAPSSPSSSNKSPVLNVHICIQVATSTKQYHKDINDLHQLFKPIGDHLALGSFEYL